MGNTFTLAYNKIQYQLDAYFKDPEAENHAKQVAAQAAQDKKVAEAKATATEKKSELDAKAAADKAAADALAERSKFSPVQVVVAKISKNILSFFTTLIIISLALYGGKLEANKAIGYGVLMRIVSFIYGSLFFFIVIPRSLYEIYFLNKTQPDYAGLPIWNYVPNGWAEQLFFGAFSYVEDNNSKILHEEVVHLYSDGLAKSLGLATTVAVAPSKPPPGVPVAAAKPPPGVPVAVAKPSAPSTPTATKV
jgi:hypothetical protein